MAFKRSAVRSRLSPPPERERFSPLPFFSFYAAFRPLHPSPNKAAEAPRSRSPSPAAADAPGNSPTARKAPPRPASYTRRSEWASNAPPETRDARCARLRFPRRAVLQFLPRLSRRTPQKNSPAGSALFHAVIRCALLLTTTTAAASPTARTPAPRHLGAETPRSERFLAPTIPAEPRFRMPVRSNAPPAKWAHAGSLSKKDTPTRKTHKALTDI